MYLGSAVSMESSGRVLLASDGTSVRALGREAEAELLRQAQAGDNNAVTKVLKQFNPMVQRMASRYAFYYTIEKDDLVAEGQLGLLSAIKNFDISLGYRFATFCTWYLAARMRNYVVRNAYPIDFGTSAENRSIFFKAKYLMEKEQGPGARERVAKRLGVPLKKLEEMLAFRSFSLDAPIKAGQLDRDGRKETLGDTIPDMRNDVEGGSDARWASEVVQKALAEMTPRLRDVLIARFMREEKLVEVGDRIGVSRERVRQLEKKGLQELKRVLANMGVRRL